MKAVSKCFSINQKLHKEKFILINQFFIDQSIEFVWFTDCAIFQGAYFHPLKNFYFSGQQTALRACYNLPGEF